MNDFLEQSKHILKHQIPCQFCGEMEYRYTYKKKVTCFLCKKQRIKLVNSKRPKKPKKVKIKEKELLTPFDKYKHGI